MEIEALQDASNGYQEKKPDQKSERERRAYIVAAFLSWVICLGLLSTAAYFRQILFSAVTTEPGFRSAVGEAGYIFGVIGVCGMVSIILGNGIVSLFLPRKVERAVSYATFIEWVGFSNEKKILNLIRLHELHVYAAGSKNAEEVENLACRMVPLYLLLIHDKCVRWALSPFQKIYFDLKELEELFDENIDVLQRARPEKLMEHGSLTKETEAKLEIQVRRTEKFRGVKGLLETTQMFNAYYKLYSYIITKLAITPTDEWKTLKQKGKPINRTSIQQMTMNILEKNPEMKAKLIELGVKGSPNPPRSVEDFFRHAMPDEIVDWRGGKPTLENLIQKHTKRGNDDLQEENEIADEQKGE